MNNPIYQGKLGTQPIAFKTRNKIRIGKVITYKDVYSGTSGKAIIESISGGTIFMARI